MSALQL